MKSEGLVLKQSVPISFVGAILDMLEGDARQQNGNR